MEFCMTEDEIYIYQNLLYQLVLFPPTRGLFESREFTVLVCIELLSVILTHIFFSF